ncbi:MAG: hypothetical protein IJW21_08525, partial [Clostridia bacterium]|nr:hypothetical protein [Clostridia bacterium]
MAIPNYLKEIGFNETKKGGRTRFEIKCTCGCETFHIYKNKFTKEEKALIKPHLDALKYVYSVGWPYWCDTDENGKTHYYKIKFGVKEEVFVPDCPSFALAESYKASCSACGKEFILFDNRFHGYDAVLTSAGLERDLEYKPTYAQKKFKDGKPRRIFFQIENYDTLEEFCEDMEEEYDEVTYSNSFSWIWVYAIDENGKKSK